MSNKVRHGKKHCVYCQSMNYFSGIRYLHTEGFGKYFLNEWKVTVLKVKFPRAPLSPHVLLARLITSLLPAFLWFLITPLSPDQNHASGLKIPECRIWGVIGRGQGKSVTSSRQLFLSKSRCCLKAFEVLEMAGRNTVICWNIQLGRRGVSSCSTPARSGDFTQAKK